ncbi:hypothetical protein FNU92_22710 [Salmonella enterica subsp. salamae]|nr:hypothetical protein [Salmonella enterica subsp. salamae]
MAGRIVPESSGEKNSFFRLLLDLENRGYFIRDVSAERRASYGREIYLTLIPSDGGMEHYPLKKFRRNTSREAVYNTIDKYIRWLRQYKRQPIKS